MTVLRELVARLGFQVDRGGFQEAERGVAKIRGALGATDQAAQLAERSVKKSGDQGGSALGALGRVAATLGLNHLVTEMVHMASDANETANILEQVFGTEGMKQVQAWSETMADSMGRSKYALRDFAGRLGAVIDPMIQNKQRAQEMATTFTALAVDLGSFFNATDEDALLALRSGLTGEYEPLKRFGVVLNDNTLQMYANAHGIQKKVTAMSIAEKTEMRYGYIMQATANAQGDAARTSQGFANSSKALWASLKDLGTDMGASVLPKVEKLIHYARDGLVRFKELARGTYILQAAMMTLAGVAGALALEMIAPFLAPAVAILGLMALVDELHAMFTGGKSIIGDWLDTLGGKGTTDAFVQRVRGWINVLEEFKDAAPDVQGSFKLISGAIDDVGYRIDRLRDKFFGLLSWWTKLDPGALLSKRDDEGHARALYQSGLLKLFGIKPRAYNQSDAEGYAEQGLGAPSTGDDIGAAVEFRERRRYEEIQADMDRRNRERINREAARREERIRALQSNDPGENYELGMSVAPDVGFGQARVVAPPPRPQQDQLAPPAPMSVQVTQHNSTVINGGDPRETKRIVEESIDERANDVWNAIPNMSGG
jgi:hypothetical protein